VNIFVPNPTTEREAGEIETVVAVLMGEFGGRKFMLDPGPNAREPGYDVVTPARMNEWCFRHGIEWCVKAATLWDVKLVRMRRPTGGVGDTITIERPTW
jgi:hypothetical protein